MGLFVLTINDIQSLRLIKAKKTMVLDIEVASHSTLNTSKGVVVCRDILNCTEEEIVDGLQEQGIVVCCHSNTRCNRVVVPSASQVLTLVKRSVQRTLKLHSQVGCTSIYLDSFVLL